MKRAKKLKPVDKLEISDFEAHPVWEFTTDEETDDEEVDETWVGPVRRTPVKNLDGRVVGTQVRLANGRLVWGLLGNVDVNDSHSTAQFLALTVLDGGRQFFLARYFDSWLANHGPKALADFLQMPIDDVFPISYDIRSCATGDVNALVGTIEKEPRERLTEAQIMALALRT